MTASERAGVVAVHGRATEGSLDDVAALAPWRGPIMHRVVTPAGAIAATGDADVHDDGRWITVFHGSLTDRRRLAERLEPDASGDAALAATALTGSAHRPDLLSGSFRLAALDRATGELRAMRSGGGTRALAWASGPAGVAVATEPRQAAAAAGLPIRPDAVVAERYVRGRLRREDAFWTGADWLLPASTVRATTDGLTISLLDVSTTIVDRRDEEAIDDIEGQLAAAVARELPADGESAGALITGGLDSASIVGFAARRRKVDLAVTTRVRTLPDSIRETELAAATAAELTNRHEVVDVTVEDLFDGMVDLLPVIGPPAVLVFGLMAASYQRAADAGATTLLDGIGGDHLFSFDPLLDAAAEHDWRRLAATVARHPRPAIRLGHRVALLNLNQRYRHPVSLGQRRREWGLHVDGAIRNRLAAHLDLRLACPYLDDGVWRSVAAAPHRLHRPGRRLQRDVVAGVLPNGDRAVKASYRAAQQLRFGGRPVTADRRATRFFIDRWLASAAE